jgi:hypothetical protein
MYIFNHIPKTGGTSMYRIIELLAGSGSVSPHTSLNEDVTYEVSAKDYEQYRVIFGHISATWNDALGPGRRWMTILRDPIDRVLSQYYFWRNSVPPSPHLSYIHAAQTLRLKEYLRQRDEKFFQANVNAQTWQLADDFRVRYRKVQPGDVLEIAKSHLVNRFALVGIFEDFRGSVEWLCRIFGSPMLERIPAENRTPGRKFVEEIDLHLIESIRELNPLDLALYDFAKKLYARERGRLTQPPCPQPLPSSGNPPQPSHAPDLQMRS